MQIGLSTCGKVLDNALFRAYRDAGELFSAAPLTVTGTPKDGLTGWK